MTIILDSSYLLCLQNNIFVLGVVNIADKCFFVILKVLEVHINQCLLMKYDY